MFNYLHGFVFECVGFKIKKIDSFYNLDSYFLYSIDLNNVGRRVSSTKKK